MPNSTKDQGLACYDRKWTDTLNRTVEDYNDLPDGSYDAVIEEARLVETASTGRPMVTWTLRITSPQEADRIIQKSRVITENTLPYLREDLEKCQLEVTKISDLPQRLPELAGRPVAIHKTTREVRTNIWFRWQARKAASGTGLGSGDLDLPF